MDSEQSAAKRLTRLSLPGGGSKSTSLLWTGSAPGLVRFKPQFDEFVEDLTETHAGLLRGLGEKAGGGHSGNRVGFQHVHLIIFKDHVGSAVSLAK